MGEAAVYTDAVPPRVCGNGHRLGPNRVILGVALCTCAPPPRCEHRHWTCRVCGDIIIGDGHTDNGLLVTPLPGFPEALRIADDT